MSDAIVNEIYSLQKDIMCFIDTWAKTVKTPIPQQEIMKQFKAGKIRDYVVAHALHELLKKNYIRKSEWISNKTAYVQIRTIDREAVLL